MTTEDALSHVRLTRVLSDTPLADVHDRAIAFALTRGAREVPWQRFERAPACALGVLDSVTQQRRVIADVMNSEIVPALDALGLSGALAWAQRQRVEAA